MQHYFLEVKGSKPLPFPRNHLVNITDLILTFVCLAMFHFWSSLFHQALSVLGSELHELCLNGVLDKREAQHFQRKPLSLRCWLLSDLIMFCYCTSQCGFSTASKNVYLACDKSRSLVINMRKPSSLKKRLFPLERIPHFREGFPPLISKNLSDSSWPEKSGKGDLPMTPKIVILFFFFFKGTR